MTNSNDSAAAARVMALLADAKRIAQEYHALTGRPLGITGEVAEYEAVRLLGLEPAPVRQPGYDAVRHEPDGRTVKLQVKGRCIRDKSKKSQRLGSIKLAHGWDAVLMVLMDERFETVAIYETDRAAVERALTETESRARKRGARRLEVQVHQPAWPSVADEMPHVLALWARRSRHESELHVPPFFRDRGRARDDEVPAVSRYEVSGAPPVSTMRWLHHFVAPWERGAV